MAYVDNVKVEEGSRSAYLRLGMLLAFIAGGVNVIAYLAMGLYVSHMSGLVSSAANAIAAGDLGLAGTFLRFVTCFFAGAVGATICINYARANEYKSGVGPALMVEGLLLCCPGLDAAMSPLKFPQPLVVGLLCFCMGLQNALITKISRAEIRTTHVTGIITDLAIDCGRHLFSRVANVSHPYLQRGRLKLNAQLLSCFFAGGIAGGLLFHFRGMSMTLPFAVMLFCVGLKSIADDRLHR